jgi:hypothetical protein
MAQENCRRRLSFILMGLAALAGVPSALFAQTASAMPGNKGFATVQEIFTRSCSACHDWAGSYDTIVAGGHIIAGSPEKSIIYQRIEKDEMPAEGDKLTADEKAFIKGWIAAGAPSTDLTISVPAAEGAATVGAATATTTPTAVVPKPQGFLFFPSKVVFHEVTGFTSTALLLGAGIIGAIHIYDMIVPAHAYRNAIGWDEDTGSQAVRSAEIINVWNADSAMRWWHVGLLVAGETLYLGDALTGISMFTKQQPGKLTKHDIHRYAFFTHAALMAAQIVLGFLTTDALSRGDHDTMIGLGVAHTAIGLAIPAVMLTAGLENLLLKE